MLFHDSHILDESNGKYSIDDNALVIAGVTEVDQGTYWCQAQNEIGTSAISPFINASLVGPPVFAQRVSRVLR